LRGASAEIYLDYTHYTCDGDVAEFLGVEKQYKKRQCETEGDRRCFSSEGGYAESFGTPNTFLIMKLLLDA
jgi:hypothetical protein